MSWNNSDGLFVKYGNEESAMVRGGSYEDYSSGRLVINFTIDWKDVQSTSSLILGDVATVANAATGSFGVLIPKGFVPEYLEIYPAVAFTSSGTIGTSTLVIGTTKASDRSTALDIDIFTTTSLACSVLDAVGEGPLVVKVGTTGAGVAWGVAATENGLVCVANSQHTSHPFTAGVMKCTLVGRYGLATV